MGAEFLGLRPFAVETVEHRFQLALRKTLPVVLDMDLDPSMIAPGAQANSAVGGAEGHRVVDQVAEHLPEAPLDPDHPQAALFG